MADKIGLLFPGQGAQRVGMGRALAEAFPVARETFAEADDLLGYDLTRLCFEGPRDTLSSTLHCQPAVLTTSVAAWRVAAEHGVRGDLALGHSLGEYAALVASGNLAFGEALLLVRERGAATAEVAADHPGAMAALIGVSDADVEALCAEAGDVWPANYNCPGQVVASGHRRGVDRLLALARARGVRAKLLDVEGAFHSVVMAPAASRLRAALGAVRLATPSVPFLSATSVALESGERLRGLLARQLTSPVRFTAAVRAALDMGVGRFVELGPRRVLTDLVLRVRRDLRAESLATPEDLPAVLRLAGAREPAHEAAAVTAV